MSHIVSAYYPPRARWYGPVFSIGDRLRRRLALDRLRPPGNVSFSRLGACMLVPGLGFYMRRRRVLAWATMAGSAILALTFLAWLGHPAANYAFGMLISLHATSVTTLFEDWMREEPLRARLGVSVIMLIAVGCLIYVPMLGWIERHWFMPVNLRERIIVVKHLASPADAEPGHWIAFKLEGRYGDGVWVQEGIATGVLLARPGDRVEFTREACKVNGMDHPRLNHMPVSGVIVVPEKRWFVWPELAIGGHGHGDGDGVADVLLTTTIISETQFIGQPYKRWFWRRQIES